MNAAVAAFSGLLAAQRQFAQAKAERDEVIVEEFENGASIPSIVRSLNDALESLGVAKHDRLGLGVSEAHVRQALRDAGKL